VKKAQPKLAVHPAAHKDTKKHPEPKRVASHTRPSQTANHTTHAWDE
jgi:hypothetical protein